MILRNISKKETKTNKIENLDLKILAVLQLAIYILLWFIANNSHGSAVYCSSILCEESSCTIKDNKKTCSKCEAYDDQGEVIWSGKCTYHVE